jgi:hypothetical protein
VNCRFETQVGKHPIFLAAAKWHWVDGMKNRTGQEEISLRSAVRLKSAELWLQLGQPMEALSELQRLPLNIRKHPKAMRICRSVYKAALA